MYDKNSRRIEPNWYPYTKRKYDLFQAVVKSYFRGGLLNLAASIINALKLQQYGDKVGRDLHSARKLKNAGPGLPR